MPYFHATITPAPSQGGIQEKQSALGLLTIAAMGESLAATAALEAVQALPDGARMAECTMAAVNAAMAAVNEDWRDGGGLATPTILLGQHMRLAYRSVGRFRAIDTGAGHMEIVIQAEDLADAVRSWHQRFPVAPHNLRERSAADLAEDGLGCLL